jgi:hypothetical protein
VGEITGVLYSCQPTKLQQQQREREMNSLLWNFFLTGGGQQQQHSLVNHWNTFSSGATVLILFLATKQ